MAVTINELEVETTDTSSTPSAAPAQPKPDTSLDLHSALKIVHERKLRLQAE